jgi:hypothetical protein
MRETLFTIPVIERLDNDSLFTGVSSRKDNNNFSSLCVYFENVECICE